MNSGIRAMCKDAGILLVITLLSGLILGGVYQLTKEPIAKQQQKKKQEACQEVFPGDGITFEQVLADDGPTAVFTASSEGNSDIDEVMQAMDASGAVLGYVITVTTHEGYGGDIQFAMGIQNDGTLNGISILSISETAGLGMRADEVLKPQFAGKNVAEFEYTKTGATADNQIDAISGATVTTNAVVNGVNAGLAYFQNMLGGAAQ